MISLFGWLFFFFRECEDNVVWMNEIILWIVVIGSWLHLGKFKWLWGGFSIDGSTGSIAYLF
jgi:hypothetical protein